jgi:hypothetical protein
MTTVQIVGIAVAVAVVLILVIALVLTRRRGDEDDSPQAAPLPSGSSFLDEAPQDTFAGLGKAEQPVEDVTIDPAVEREARRAAEAERATSERAPDAPAGVPPIAPPAAQPAATPQRTQGDLGLGWGPSGSDVNNVAPETVPIDAEVTGEMPAVTPPPAGPEPASTPESVSPPSIDKPLPESGGHASPESARPAEGGSVAPEAAPESDAGRRMVPLSSIIVTTSRKLVDVDDPEVRRMLTDLVKFEIDQATQFKREGQTIDAVLQLTEAEKISRALGMDEAARHIHQMMQDIQAG